MPSFVSPRVRLLLALLVICSSALLSRSASAADASETITLERYRVTARQSDLPEQLPWTQLSLSPGPLSAQPLDEQLRAIPGFSLFRRSSSTTSHPTTQGVTLRGIGPAGASRALVLLDGVPLNDPFGGWVNWLSLDAAQIEHIEITRGGGAGAWGNAALGGTLQLFSAPSVSTSTLRLLGGAHEQRDASLTVGLAKQNWSAQLTARDFHGPRLDVLRADQRGSVDEAAYADLRHYGFTLAHQRGPLAVGLSVRTFEEKRGNGTALARNSTDATDGSLWLTRTTTDFAWDARLWKQQRDFASTFTAVDATRTIETLSLDQYDVPADGLGASFSARKTLAAHALLFGLDAREAEGVTHEFFRNLGAGFTRDREAGARQRFLGIFAEDTITLAPQLRATLGARYDRWEIDDARRIERDRASGVAVREEFPAARDGERVNARAGLAWTPLEPLTLKAAAYTGYRVPTLNELFRPFRVRNDTTEANPTLRPEKLRGAELGAIWKPRAGFSIEATAYQNRIEDLIANTTLAFGPATLPGFDPVPAGGVLRQRQNLGEADVRGFELSLRATPQRDWKTQLWLAHNDARWRSGPLDGLRLAQTPRWTAGAGAEWQATPTWSLGAQGRVTDRQFEDDVNARRLGRAVVCDVYLTGQLTPWLKRLSPRLSGEARLSIDNVFDEEIETAKTADGLVSIGAPRQLALSLQLKW